MQPPSPTRTERPLTKAEISRRLLPLLSDIISPQRDPDQLFTMLAGLRRIEQEFIAHWVDIIARTNAELAYRFALNTPRARSLLAFNELDSWILQAMDVYDHEGLYAAVRALSDIERFVWRRDQQLSMVHTKKISRVLEAFLQGLSGRHLGLEAGNAVWTDSETVYLPSSISHFAIREDNFSLAKCLAAILWAQTRFGTFALAGNGTLHIQTLRSYEDPARAHSLFAFFESHRLLARIEPGLPGLAREITDLIFKSKPGHTYMQWQSDLSMLATPEASVTDSLNLVRRFYPNTPPLTPFNQITFNVEVTEATIGARMAREREALLKALEQLVQADNREYTATADAETIAERFQLERGNASTENGDLEIELSLDGQPVPLSPTLLQLLQSILQDIGTLPVDYLTASATGSLPQPAAMDDSESADDDVFYGEPFPEWDHRRQHYHRDWCYIRELEVEESDAEFVSLTLAKYANALPRLRKTFEALRSEDRWLCRQRLGDDLDLDALVEALADQHAGMEPDDRLYKRLSRNTRNIAVLFMVDMSGSTKGWVNDAERESLVLLCEALQILGDRYAIYGFSGMTRRRCEIFKVKNFEESYSDAVRGRISGIEARDYTRMGASIRYLNRLLEAVPARTKLLITLSDGKPDDFDGYGGEYGIEDTRQALIESRQAGIHPFCITIDKEARAYLPHMYGRHSYTVVDKVHELPLKVAEIYRRLTH